MKTHPKIRSIVVAMVILSFAGSGSALAGGKHDRHGYGHSGHHDKHYSYYNHGKNKHKRRYYKGNRHYYYNRGYGRNYYRYDDNSDEKLLIGLLVGGLVGYAISNTQGAAPREASPAIYEPYQGSAASCLQEREYQMTVIVGGRKVDAYGTACLQPDGSWSRGPARLPSF